MKITVKHLYAEPKEFSGTPDQIMAWLRSNYGGVLRKIGDNPTLSEIVEAMNNMQAFEVEYDATLSKGLAHAFALGAALATGAAQAQPPVSDAGAAIQRASTPPEPVKWHTEGLHPDLYAVAHLESGFGKNTQHPFFKDEYNTAHGALGMKPITAHEEYLRSPTLQSMYGEFKDPHEFIQKFKSDPKFYNLLATTHFLHLKKKHGSTLRAVFGWRHGTGAAAKASEQQIVNDPYVQKYSQLTINSGVKPGQQAQVVNDP